MDILRKSFTKLSLKGNVCVIDVETTGLPEKKSYNEYYNYKKLQYYDNSRIVQFSWSIFTPLGKVVKQEDFIIKRNNFTISDESIEIHKITNEISDEKGIEIEKVFAILEKDLKNVGVLVAHNFLFDSNIIKSELYRYKFRKALKLFKKNLSYCTMNNGKKIVNIWKEGRYGEYLKYPKLSELNKKLFEDDMICSHNSKYDVYYCARCYFKMINDIEIPTFAEMNQLCIH